MANDLNQTLEGAKIGVDVRNQHSAEPLPYLIDAAVHLLLLKDGDRDHMNNSAITCEQSMAIVEILRRCKSDIGS